MFFSVVTTLYCSAPYIDDFYGRICDEVGKITDNFELLFVNDGSPDDSLIKAVSLQEKDNRVKVIDLSRNFGHHAAMMTGLEMARGSYVFLIDCDLEEEPELLGKFYSELQKTGADVVYGVQQKRKGDLFERVSGGLFWDLLNGISRFKMPKNQLVARLMTNKYVESLVGHRESEIFLPGLWAITGFRQVPLSVTKLSKSRSTYTFRKKIAQLVDAVTSFSSTPLVFVFYIGAIISMLSGSYAAWLVIRRIFFSIYMEGWLSLIVSIWFIGGLTIFSIGLLGIYLAKVFLEVKSRPRSIIRKIYEQHVSDQKQQQTTDRPVGDDSPVDQLNSSGFVTRE